MSDVILELDLFENGHLEVVQYLIEKGANIEVKTHNQKTPLHFACENGHLSVVQYRIEKGPHVEAIDKCERTQITPRMRMKRTLMMTKHSLNSSKK